MIVIPCLFSTFGTLFSGFQMVWSYDWVDPLNTGHFLHMKQTFLSGFQNQTIWQPDIIGPFKYQNCSEFSWLLYTLAFCNSLESSEDQIEVSSDNIVQ